MQDKTISLIEGLLLVSSRELSVKRLAEFLQIPPEEIRAAIGLIKEKYNQQDSGIHLSQSGEKIQLTTNPADGEALKKFLHEEDKGELTKPALETLTIIAYRQPITKAEIEQIRGINCSLILRNLLIRGMIEIKEDQKNSQTFYFVTLDFLKFLGINDVQELPSYERLNSDENLQKLIDQKESLEVKINI